MLPRHLINMYEKSILYVKLCGKLRYLCLLVKPRKVYQSIFVGLSGVFSWRQFVDGWCYLACV